MFPLLAVAILHTPLAIIGLLAAALMIGAVLPFSGTNTGPADDCLGSFGAYVDAFMGGAEYTAAGAISQTVGKIVLHGNSALAMTLAAPVAGLPSAGGNDYQTLDILCDGTGAHTITTPSNGINGNKHIATFGGAVADSITLTAFGGVWYAKATSGVTLS